MKAKTVKIKGTRDVSADVNLNKFRQRRERTAGSQYEIKRRIKIARPLS